jgi:hypothetical protein
MIDKLSSISHQIQVPSYDKRDERFDKIISFLSLKKLPFELSEPGNDEFAYKLSFKEGRRVVYFCLRFEYSFFTIINYLQITGKGFSYIENIDLSERLKEVYDFLRSVGFEYIDHAKLLSTPLRLVPVPVDDGVICDNLLSVYFGDV